MSLKTRVVPRHVYDNRRNTTNVKIPRGYRRVWRDDRLNTHRAERTLEPAITTTAHKVPAGYRPVDRGDGRLNPNRGIRTAAGDVETDQIWQRTVPRQLAPIPNDRTIVRVPKGYVHYRELSEYQSPIRVSSRSQPKARAVRSTGSGKRYIRVSTHVTQADAKRVAKVISRQGLPVRYGSVKRSDGTYRVVLAGPFTSDRSANAALSRVQSAGFATAKVIR
ncbi:MAG: SPOR domain-containing protein [Pseudomonadota bacterium]